MKSSVKTLERKNPAYKNLNSSSMIQIINKNDLNKQKEVKAMKL